MKERLVGVIEKYPYIRWNNTGELEISGHNCNDVYITLKVKLPDNKLSRLSAMSCAIRQLKRLFSEIKEQIEERIAGEERAARGW